MGNPFQNSSGSAPSSGQTTSQMYNNYLNYLPGMSNASNAQLMPTSQAQLQSELATTPIQNAFNLQQLQQYGLPTAQANQQVQNSNALAGAQTNLNTLNGAGGQAAMTASNLQRATNPNYANVADASANKTAGLLNSFSLNGLSPGEYNATERSLNQSNAVSGNLGLNNGMNTISNAMNFGGAFNNKIGQLNNILGTAAGTGNMLANNGINSTSVALGQPQASSPFTSTTFTGTNPTGSNGISSNLLGQFGGISQATIAPTAQSNYQNSPQGSFATNAGACCFIFMEAYYGDIPQHVRQCRDRYYTMLPRVANGYKRMAIWLVPLMRNSTLIRMFVWTTMILPLTQHGAFVKRINSKLAIKHRLTRKFWFTVWSIYGK